MQRNLRAVLQPRGVGRVDGQYGRHLLLGFEQQNGRSLALYALAHVLGGNLRDLGRGVCSQDCPVHLVQYLQPGPALAQLRFDALALCYVLIQRLHSRMQLPVQALDLAELLL